MSTLEDLGMDPLLPPEEPHPCDDCGRNNCTCDDNPTRVITLTVTADDETIDEIYGLIVDIKCHYEEAKTSLKIEDIE